MIHFNWIISILLVISTVFIQNSSEKMSRKLVSVDFEVFGIVQGVFFRKYTEKEAQNLSLKGYCRNTNGGTVEGTIQGDVDKINKMKNWLQRTGSPTSRIDKAEFKNEKEIDAFTFNDFSIRR
ncbi:acylphosphatase-2-like [Harmonia axyridis]|uniref:acylphosphatase-2-like n=1 Tax=Harmonia axyridis TaxID=115357 RepID=UPI001E2773A7|nr:acylphosphatase-2-like [Harmonia axyridis]